MGSRGFMSASSPSSASSSFVHGVRFLVPSRDVRAIFHRWVNAVSTTSPTTTTRRWSKFLRQHNWENHVDPPQRMYLPFWMFHAEGRIRYTGRCGDVRVESDATVGMDGKVKAHRRRVTQWKKRIVGHAAFTSVASPYAGKTFNPIHIERCITPSVKVPRHMVSLPCREEQGKRWVVDGVPAEKHTIGARRAWDVAWSKLFHPHLMDACLEHMKQINPHYEAFRVTSFTIESMWNYKEEKIFRPVFVVDYRSWLGTFHYFVSGAVSDSVAGYRQQFDPIRLGATTFLVLFPVACTATDAFLGIPILWNTLMWMCLLPFVGGLFFSSWWRQILERVTHYMHEKVVRFHEMFRVNTGDAFVGIRGDHQYWRRNWNPLYKPSVRPRPQARFTGYQRNIRYRSHGSNAPGFINEEKNLYELLDLDYRRKPSLQTIQHAFRTKAKQQHPDQVPESHRVQADETFRRTLQAYEVLKDPVLRGYYDEGGKEALREVQWRWYSGGV